jgi:polygalacturonase
VKDITIRDSVLVNHDNGIRIKTNSGTTGEVTRYVSPSSRHTSSYAIDCH